MVNQKLAGISTIGAVGEEIFTIEDFAWVLNVVANQIKNATVCRNKCQFRICKRLSVAGCVECNLCLVACTVGRLVHLYLNVKSLGL